jgi:hypothetical protein
MDDRLAEVQEQRLENVTGDSLRRDQEEIHPGHAHQEQIDMGRPGQAPMLGEFRAEID